MKRITVDLDDDFHRRLKIYCAEKGFIITELIRKLLAEELQKADKKKPKQ